MTKKEKKLNIWTYVGKKKKIVIFTFLLLLFAVLLGRLVTYLNTFLVDNAIIPENYSLLFGVGGALVGLLVIEAVCFFVQNKKLDNKKNLIFNDKFFFVFYLI